MAYESIPVSEDTSGTLRDVAFDTFTDGGTKYAQIVKLGIGADGAVPTQLAFGQATAAASLPVVLASDAFLNISAERAEDSVHSSGNIGMFVLGVRNDGQAVLTSTDGDYSAFAVDGVGRLAITDLGGSITVDGTVAISGTVTVDTELPTAETPADNLTNATAAPRVNSLNYVFDGSTWDRALGNSTDGTLVNLGANNDVTVTGTVSVSGTVTVDSELPAAETPADNLTNATAAPRVGGLNYWFDGSTWDRARGDSTDGLLVNLGANNDVTVSGTVSATQSGTWSVRLTDGTDTADVLDLTNSNPLTVAIVDGAGTQITSFGGGTQYAEDTAHASGDQVTMAGVVQQTADTALSADGDRSLLQVDANGFLKVNIKAGAGSGGTAATDDAAFTAGSGSGTPMMGFATSDVVDSGDVGVVRMSVTRDLFVSLRDSAGDSAMDDANNALRVNVVAGSGAGVTHTDDAAFTAATDDGVPIFARFDDAAVDSVDEDDAGVLRMSANRNLYIRIRDNAGNERGANVTAANELSVLATAQPGVDIGDVTINNASGGAAVNIQDGGNSITIDGTVAVSGTVTVDTEFPAAETPADNLTNATAAPRVNSLSYVFDGTTWDRLPGTTADGALVNLGANNDVTVTGTVTVDTEFPAAETPADNLTNATAAPRVNNLNYVFDGTAWDRALGNSTDGALVNLGANNDVTVTGTVTVDTELPAAETPADNLTNATAAPRVNGLNYVFDGTTWDRAPGTSADGTLVNLGANNDVTVTTLPALVAGSANIGDVDVLTVPAPLSTTGNGTAATALRVTVASDSTGVLGVNGTTAHDSPVANAPILNAYEARTTDGTAVSAAGDVVRGIADTLGKQVVLPGAVHDRHVRGTANYTTTTASDLIAAAGAGVRIVVTGILVTNAHATVGTKVEIRDGTTVRVIGFAAAAGGGFSHGVGYPLFISTANTAITGRCVTSGSDIDIVVSGYTIGN